MAKNILGRITSLKIIPLKIKKLKTILTVRSKAEKVYKRAVRLAERRPLASFFSVLGILFLLIVIGNLLRSPIVEPPKLKQPKQVEVYKIGAVPKITLQAQVEKSGVVQIIAQTAGIVQAIYVSEGGNISKGQRILSLSSNYQGGNALALSRQLAEKQNQLIEESYPLSKELISKQRDLANQTLSNFEKMRDITNQSVSDTQSLVDLNNNIISTLNETIRNLESDPGTATSSASVILASKQMVSQFQSANLQLNNQLRSAQIQTDTDKPPTQLAQLSKDITLKHLDLQDKSLDLNREISKLQLSLARVNEALMYPATPFNGRIEKIFVRIGQAVNPGTPLAAITGTNNRSVKAVVYLSKEIALNTSKLEETVFMMGGKRVSVLPSYITNEAVQGSLFAVIYSLPQENFDMVGDKEYIETQVPIGYPDTGATIPYIPLDAVYQTENEAYVFVEHDGKAVSRKIELGEVMGRFVRVSSGLTSSDAVILDRSVIASDPVEVK